MGSPSGSRHCWDGPIDQSSRRRVEPNDRPQLRHTFQHTVRFTHNARTRINGRGPFGHPPQAVGAIETIEIRQAGKKTVGMFAHVGAKRSAAKLHHRARDRPMPDGAPAQTAELAQRSINHGKGVGGGIHRLECAIRTTRPPGCHTFFRWLVAIRLLGGNRPPAPEPCRRAPKPSGQKKRQPRGLAFAEWEARRVTSSEPSGSS